MPSRIPRERPVLSVAFPAAGAVDRDDRFDQLFEQFYPRLYPLAYRLLGERRDAEDTLQEAFLKLAAAPVLERPDEEVAAWLRRVCLNLGLNRLRDQRRARERLERAGRLELSQQESDGSGPAQTALRQETQREVRRTLARLPDRQANCLLLRHAGYFYAEIAATLGIALGSIGVLLARAERAFRTAHQEIDHALP
jgi:RNA polymerase sigma-70 factor (ECF subfamily)